MHSFLKTDDDFSINNILVLKDTDQNYSPIIFEPENIVTEIIYTPCSPLYTSTTFTP